MGKQEFDNLVKIKRLKSEPPTHSEYTGMAGVRTQAPCRCAERRPGPRQPIRSRLCAAHRLALAALRREAYRSEGRITVFQTLVHTLGTDRAHIQTFLKAHNERNLAEYQGRVEIDPKLLADLVRSTKALETEVSKLAPPVED